MEFSYTTQRLQLVAAHPSLAMLTQEFYAQNKNFLKPFEPERTLEFYTKAGQKEELKQAYKQMCKGKSLCYWLMPLKKTEVIGTVMLNQIAYGNMQSGVLAYRLAQDQTGNGYAREAVAKLITTVFEELHLHRIEANIIPRNISSQNLVKDLGFVHEGMRAKYLQIDGIWQDHDCFSVLNENWKR